MKTALNWLEARVRAVRDLTPTVREICIEPAQGITAFAPGSHVQVQVLVAGRVQTRSYSLVSVGDDGKSYRIAVKCLPQGRGGSLAMWRLAAGDRLRVSDPTNDFPLVFGAPAYLLVAGGIGVTPLVSMAKALAARNAPLHMRYAASSQPELAYAAQLSASLGDRLQTVWGQHLDLTADIAQLPAGGQLYVCGPQPMLEAARRAWAVAGRSAADLRFETFGSSGQFATQAFRVQIPRHALDVMVPADSSLLDVLEAAGVQTLSGCKRGECGLCAMDVLAVAGAIDHRDVYLSEYERQANTRICVCVSRVVGGVTLDSAFRSELA